MSTDPNYMPSPTPSDEILEVVEPENTRMTLSDNTHLEPDPMNEHPKYTTEWYKKKSTSKKKIFIELLFSEQAKKEAGYCYDKLLPLTLKLLEVVRSFDQDESRDDVYEKIMSLIRVNDRSLFECPKCKTKFTNVNAKTVKIAFCGHLYCPKCLEILRKTNTPCLICKSGLVRAPFIEDLQIDAIVDDPIKEKEIKKGSKRVKHNEIDKNENKRKKKKKTVVKESDDDDVDVEEVKIISLVDTSSSLFWLK